MVQCIIIFGNKAPQAYSSYKREHHQHDKKKGGGDVVNDDDVVPARDS